jgi:hypothetical protein
MMPTPTEPKGPRRGDPLHALEKCLVTLIIVLIAWLGLTSALDSEQEFALRENLSSFLSITGPVDSAGHR